MQKVAAYCRVSTDKEDQINSLDSQKRYFYEYINRNPSWELTNIYVDEGVTGTSTKKRQAFQEMINDARMHCFDLILTKEISRFARNTLDSIYYTRKLKDLHIGVIFMNDNINTLDSDAELRLTIMSSIAQEESRKTSERVKWGQRQRMEQGVVFGRDLLGYKVKEGKLYINEAGAEIVRLIFHKFTNEGKGTHVIARELQEAGIPTMGHNTEWSNVVILRILRNDKYAGDLIQKKTFTPNYLNHEKKYNLGEEELIILKNHHEPIITRELYERTQLELKRRSRSAEEKVKHSNRYCFSGKLKCGICGASYVSRNRKRRDNSIQKVWRCYKAVKYGRRHIDMIGTEVGCNSESIQEEYIKLLMQKVVMNCPVDKFKLTTELMQEIKNVVLIDNSEYVSAKRKNRMNQIILKRRDLTDLYLSKVIDKEDYQALYKQYTQELSTLENECELTYTDSQQEVNQERNKNEQIDESKQENSKDIIIKIIEDYIYKLLQGDVWNDTFYRQILDKIVIKDDRHFDIALKYLSQNIKVTLKD